MGIKSRGAPNGKPVPRSAYILAIAFPVALLSVAGLAILALNYFG